jgi:two-component system, chemotaxis family, sensor kinase Cph1
LESLTPTASGVLAVKLSTARPDYLMWFRKEQLLTVTWAGDPSKPMVANNPLELSPRSSFAAWSEIVRGTALPWTSAELALGRAIGVALIDIIVQVHGVRLLIAEHQLAGIRATVQSSSEPVVIADRSGRVLFCNEAFTRIAQCTSDEIASRPDVSTLFDPPQLVRQSMAGLHSGQPPWRGEAALARVAAPVSVRAEIVQGRDGTVLGYILTMTDLSDSKRAAHARRQLEQTMHRAARGQPLFDAPVDPVHPVDDVIGTILTSASLAAMDIADGATGLPAAALLQELEASTQRATALYDRIRASASRR